MISHRMPVEERRRLEALKPDERLPSDQIRLEQEWRLEYEAREREAKRLKEMSDAKRLEEWREAERRRRETEHLEKLRASGRLEQFLREGQRHEEERLERLREAEARRKEAERGEELDLIRRARELEAERKHQADVAWAKRVLAMGDADTHSSRPGIPEAIRHAVWRRDEARCAKCGSNQALEFDHIIPVAMGGATTERNLQLLCMQCNRRKGKSLG